MKLHREGTKIILITLIICLILAWVFIQVIPWLWLQYALIAGLGVELIWTISFFRVPKRTINFNEDHVLASADGKVVAIEEVTESEFFNDKRIY